MPQTSISDDLDLGANGSVADSCPHKHARSMYNGEASASIEPGLMVVQSSPDQKALRPSAVSDRLAGLAGYDQANARDSDLDDDGNMRAGVYMSVLDTGRGIVTAEDVVTPASGVHVRMVASQGGAALVVADFVFTAEADTEIFTKAAHGLLTGDGPFQVSNSGGALPAGITAATNYWIIKIDADNFYLATTRALALAGTHLSITTDGTGTQTMADTASTERVVTGKAGALRGTADGAPLVVADLVFTAEADDEKMTSTAHGLLTGDGPVRVSNSGGALPAGLAAGTDYWIEKFDANVFYFATSRANALAGTHLSITTDGTGTQTLSDTADTERVTTVDISKFARWLKSTTLPGQQSVVDLDFANVAAGGALG